MMAALTTPTIVAINTYTTVVITSFTTLVITIPAVMTAQKQSQRPKKMTLFEVNIAVDST